MLGLPRLRLVSAATAAIAVLALGAVGGSFAAFTDTATATTGTFTAGTAVMPTGIKCTAGSFGAGGVSWTAPSGPPPNAYRVTYQSAGGTANTVDVTTTSWKPSAGLLDLGTTYAVTVQSLYGTAWLSTSTTSVNIRRTSLIVDFLSCP